MKKIILYLILVMVLTVLVSAEIDNPLPDIKVTFQERVVIDEARIIGTDVVLSLENKNLEYQTIDNLTFVFIPQYPLSDGDYKFELIVIDFLGNPSLQFEKVFTVEAGETDIVLVDPKFGYSGEEKFDITILTTTFAECKYASIYNNQIPFDHPELTLFNETGERRHIIKDFEKPEGGEPQEIYMICKDPSGDVKFKSFNFYVDKTKPTISVRFDPNKVADYPGQTKLIVESSEPVICRYSETTDEYLFMETFETSERPDFYTNKKKGYSIDYSGWEPVIRNGPEIKFKLKDIETEDVGFILNIESSANLKTLADVELLNWNGNLIQGEYTLFKRYNAYEQVFNVTILSPQIQVYNILISKEDQVFILTFISNLDSYDEYIDNFETLLNNFDPDYGEKFSFSSYSETNKQLLRFEETEPGSKKYSVLCQDRSNLFSDVVNSTLTFDLQAATDIKIIKPSKYSNSDSNIELEIRTNKLSYCEYKKSTSTQYSPTSTSSSRLGITHIKDLGKLGEGEHTYDIKCTGFETSTKSYTFFIDKTKPTSVGVNVQNASCLNKRNKTRIKAEMFADDLSGIAYYNYSIEGYDEIITDWKTTSSSEIDKTVEHLDIGEDYTIFVKAIDNAGWSSSKIESREVKVYSSDSEECREDSPPTTSLSKTGVNSGTLIEIECNDESECDESRFKYGTSDLSGDCLRTTSYTEGVLLSETKYFCWEVYDTTGKRTERIERVVVRPDSDGDGILNVDDVCDNTPSSEFDTIITESSSSWYGCGPSEIDSDKDGMPDVWETRHGLNKNSPDDRDLDPDEDGSTNFEEYKEGCDPTVPDCTGYGDLDGDRVPDNLDQCPNTAYNEINNVVDDKSSSWYGCGPSGIDTDLDGMPDGWEDQYSKFLDKTDPNDAKEDYDKDNLINVDEYKFGTKPDNKDSDGDGFTDNEELIANTDPLNSNSHPEKSSVLSWLLFMLGLILILGGGGYVLYKKYKDGTLKLSIPKKIKIQSKVKPKQDFKPQLKPKMFAPKFSRNVLKKKQLEERKKRSNVFNIFSSKEVEEKEVIEKPRFTESHFDKLDRYTKHFDEEDVFGKLTELHKGSKDKDVFDKLEKLHKKG